jgi:hypothetical protein
VPTDFRRRNASIPNVFSEYSLGDKKVITIEKTIEYSLKFNLTYFDIDNKNKLPVMMTLLVMITL